MDAATVTTPVSELTSTDVLCMISLVFLIGTGMQWVSWRVKLPSILLLLLSGIMVGPVFGWVDTDAMLGPIFEPLVGISVALILFEGGLSLKFSEFLESHRVLTRLLTVGIFSTWGLVTLAAYFILGFSWPLALLLGAILIVTGPTVIIPLLRMVRPKGQVNAILKWEGILNDPIGAIIAVIIYEVILAGDFSEVGFHVVQGIVSTIANSTIIAGLGAGCLYWWLRFRLIPNFLRIPVVLTLVAFTFTLSNLIMDESGLLTVTLMGIFLANQRSVDVAPILEFKENLRVMLISCLFVILAARLQLEDLAMLNTSILWFLLVLILVVRPASIFLSSVGTPIQWTEKVFLSWMAPRGIVAAAVASIMALKLVANGYPDAERFVPVVFMTIMGTITVYGLTAFPIAKWLNLVQVQPQGVLFIGANAWVIQLAKALQQHSHPILLIDTNDRAVKLARRAGLPVRMRSVLSDRDYEALNLDGMGTVIACTSSDKVNTLATLRCESDFGTQRVFQIAPEPDQSPNQASENTKTPQKMTKELTSRYAFAPSPNYSQLSREFVLGATVETYTLEHETSPNNLYDVLGKHITLLFVKHSNGTLNVINPEYRSNFEEGDLIFYINPAPIRKSTPTETVG